MMPFIFPFLSCFPLLFLLSLIIHLFLTPTWEFAAKSGPAQEQGCLTQLQLLSSRSVKQQQGPVSSSWGNWEDVGMDGDHLAAGQVVEGLFMARKGF